MGSFTYYVITKGEGLGLITLMYFLLYAEFDYGSGGGGLETDKK